MSTLDRGVTIAGYRVDGVLGVGGMGVVYRATQLSLNRLVALKVLAAEISDDKAFRARFVREGQLQAAIDHPHIVTVYEAGESDHGLFIAMRVVQGPTLKDLILSGRLDHARIVKLLGQVADALDAAHDKGLIHRDVKPQNILTDAHDRAYLADFGLTRAPDAEGPTETGQFVGTLDYISPEQARGEGATGASDVYALTGVLCEALTGQVPYPRQSEAAVMFAHLQEPPPKPTESRPDLPPAIDDVIAHGMAKDPTQRPASARALVEEAAEALGTATAAATTRPHEAAPTASTTASPAAATRISTAADLEGAKGGVGAGVWVAMAAVALVALAVVGYLVGHGGSSKSSASGPALTQSASAGGVGISFPGAWRRVSENPSVGDVQFRDPMVIAGTGGRMTAGTVDATGPRLLPDSVKGGRGEPVSLGDLQALRYRGLSVGGKPMTLYVVPTSAGVATLACAPPAGALAARFLQTCERAAGTLHLFTVKPFPLGPSEAHAKALDRELNALAAKKTAGERALAAAKLPDAQANATAALQAAYRDASRKVNALEVTPFAAGANGRLAFALGRVADAYGYAAKTLRAGNRARYAKAQVRLRNAAAALGRAKAALVALGYRVS